MLWLGQRARHLARVVALAPPRASAPHQIRNPDDQRVASGVVRYSHYVLVNQTSVSDINDATDSQRMARLPTLQMSQHEIPAVQKQRQPAYLTHTHRTRQTQHVETTPEHLITRLRRALQHRNGGAARARATALSDVVRCLTRQDVLASVAADPLTTTLLLKDLARCGPVTRPLSSSATYTLHHLITATSAKCPPDTLLANIQALIRLNVPIPPALQDSLHTALFHASPHSVADLLWCVICFVAICCYHHLNVYNVLLLVAACVSLFLMLATTKARCLGEGPLFFAK